MMVAWLMRSRSSTATRKSRGACRFSAARGVPVQALFDYLEGGETLDQFLDQFPSVSKQQALAALDLARESVLARARSA